MTTDNVQQNNILSLSADSIDNKTTQSSINSHFQTITHTNEDLQ